ncbi:MAG: DNA polymerase I [Anaerolineales bacterium]|nr:DNA polymerase I [Anaerolineales bacterium]
MSAASSLFLIDGHALAYRTYYALTRGGDPSRWITSSGEPTAGTYGFVSVLLRLLEQEKPEYLAVSFDTGRTFRDDIFPDYKGTRQKMPDDLRLQIKRIRQVVKAFGIPILEADGYEADDVLGTIAHKAAEEGVRVVILTGDRDLLQLATRNVTIRLAGQKLSEAQDYGPDEVYQRYSIRPDQIVDYKALVGDSSDNIPGVRGVGDKSAVKFLQEYETLDNIFAHIDEIPDRFRKKLEENREDAYLSQKLAAIITDVSIDFNLDACRAAEYDRTSVAELFRELEFRSLLDRMTPVDQTGQLPLFAVEQEPEKAFEDGEVIHTFQKLAKLTERLSQLKELAVDVESTGTDPLQSALVGISLAINDEEGFYLPVGHDPATAGLEQLPLQEVVDALRPVLENPGISKIGHNLKYDSLLLQQYGITLHPYAFDTMIAEWLCNPDSRNLGLKNLAWVRLGIEMTQIKELIGTGRNQRTMAQVPVSEAAPYAIADTVVCMKLKPQLEKELKEKSQWQIFQEMEMPLIPILAAMEQTGILLDTAFLQKLTVSLDEQLQALEKRIYELAGKTFNLNSPPQMSSVLFEDLALKPPDRTRRTKSGYYSTAASVLEELQDKNPIIDVILEHRELAKIKSTYADALPREVNPATGRVHSSFKQTGSVTGRLASSNPNLQNIPVRSKIGKEIRRAFIAEKGWTLLAVDYSQIELRIVAHMSGDRAMLQAFREGKDIHSATAAAISGEPLEKITPSLRRQAKAVNFGLIYGMSAFGLSRSTDLTLPEAETFVQRYFEQFPGVKQYLENIRQQARTEGYVETMFGHRRYFPQLLPDARSISETEKSRALREAINAPIQGTAADIIKFAMIRLPQKLAAAGLSARLLLQVHDELVLECPQSELETTIPLIKEIMEGAAQLDVPLIADAKAGHNWAALEPIE